MLELLPSSAETLSLKSQKGGKFMAQNFKIVSYKINDSLHMMLTGDFDVDSAMELINTLLTHGTGCWYIFIDTNNLETIHPFSPHVFRMNLSNFKKQLNNLFFTGRNKYKISLN
jgi:hypothetical protein